MFSPSEHPVDATIMYGLVVTGNEQALIQIAQECAARWPTMSVQVHRYPVGARLFVLADRAPDDVRRLVELRIAEGAPVEIANSGNQWLEVLCYQDSLPLQGVQNEAHTNALETAIQLLTANILAMRTDMLVIKVLLNDLVEQLRDEGEKEKETTASGTATGGVDWTPQAVHLFESYPDDGLDFDQLAKIAEHLARKEPNPLTHAIEVDVYHVDIAYERLRTAREKGEPAQQ